MDRLFLISIITVVTLFTYQQISFGVCVEGAPDTFTCNSSPPNPDPNGVQQGGNNNGVQVHVLPGGNIDTNNFSAIDLGNGANHVDVNRAAVVGEDRAINTGNGPDEITLNRAKVEGTGSTLFFNSGDDNVVIKDSDVITTVGGITISVGPGSDTAIITGSTISTGPNISRAFTGGPGKEDVTIINSTITNASSDVTVSLGADDDKVFVSYSTITNATADFPLRGAAGDDEITLGTGAVIPGGIDCDFENEPQGFDTLIFAMEVLPGQIAALTELIENSSTPDGAVTINGILYLYRNCDQLIADLRVPEPRPIPTLSEWGIIAMAGVLGIAGLIAARRRQSKVI